MQKLSWLRKAAQKLSNTANNARVGQEDAATAADVQQEPKQPPVDTDTEQECPEPPVDVPFPATTSTATRMTSKSTTDDSSLADKASGATAISAAATSPAMQRLRALRQQRIASPRDSAMRTSLTVVCTAFHTLLPVDVWQDVADCLLCTNLLWKFKSSGQVMQHMPHLLLPRVFLSDEVPVR